MSGFATLAEALTRGRGREIPFRCPVHDDSQASASVNRVKGLWVCYACGARGNTEGIYEEEETRFAADILELLEEREQRIYPERWLDQFDAGDPHPYWRSRFSEAACRHFRLGYDHAVGTPVYPIRDNLGRVLGVVRRSLLEVGPKYLYPRGLNKSELLYGYRPDQAGDLVLVEGAPDAWACWEAGYTAFGLYGALLHPAQLRLIHRVNPRRIILALDNDSAGRAAIYGRLARDGDLLPGLLTRLEREGLPVVVPDWDGVSAKDLAECDVATRRTLLDSAEIH